MANFLETPNFFIPLSDGRKLSARMWQPVSNSNSNFPAPSILEYLPYRKRDGTALRDEGNHPSFAMKGYVCIRVDLPGQGDSDRAHLSRSLNRCIVRRHRKPILAARARREGGA